MTATDLREIENAFSKLDIRGLLSEALECQIDRWQQETPRSGPRRSEDSRSAGRPKPDS